MNKNVLGILALSMVAILGAGFVVAMPFGNGLNADLTDSEKAEMQAQHEEMQTAIENGDYETWKSLMNDKIVKMQEQITQENFNEIQERHAEREEFRQAIEEARESRDFSKMQELKEEYGIGRQGFGSEKGPRRGSCGMNKGLF